MWVKVTTLSFQCMATNLLALITTVCHYTACRVSQPFSELCLGTVGLMNVAIATASFPNQISSSSMQAVHSESSLNGESPWDFPIQNLTTLAIKVPGILPH